MNLKFLVLFLALLIFVSADTVFAQTDSNVSVTVFSDKPSYLFGDTAVIQGSVSEEVFVMKPHFTPQEIRISISGYLFEKSITLYPDNDLSFKFTQNLQQVLGITGGDYVVSVQYGDAISQTDFSVGHEIIVNDTEEEQTLSIDTDRLQYLPGSNVQIIAMSDFIIPLEGMYFEVHDPNGLTISAGNLFPVNDVFSTSIFLNTVNPRYGTYEIVGTYSDQSVTATFDLIEDVKENKLFSLWTDKEVYGLGDTVSISGRLNNFWVSSLNLEITQMRNLSLDDIGGFANNISDTVFLEGDSSFTYSFKIPVESGLGDYLIKFSNEIGTVTKSITVSENLDEPLSSDDPFVVFSNADSYSLGDVLSLNGKIIHPIEKSDFNVNLVTFTISDSLGNPLEMIGFNRGEEDPDNNSIIIDEIFSILPDSSGHFSFELPITRSQFDVGEYTINLKYTSLLNSLSFSVVDPVDISSMLLSIEKDVYGLNEPVTLVGLLPPLGESSISISLTAPNGRIFHSNALTDNQQFTWNWVTPVSEIKSVNSKDSVSTNIGIYKINVATASFNQDVFFKVSLDPENDFISKSTLFVDTEKSLYTVGDKLKIFGNVLAPSTGGGFTGYERVYLQVIDSNFPYALISESAVYPNQGGEFESSFKISPGVYFNGLYNVKANYYGHSAESVFSVVSDFEYGSDDELTLIISTDKSEYSLGDVVSVTGKPNNLVYLEKFDVSVIKKSDIELTCGSFICGVHQGPVTSLFPSPSGSFEYQFMIDDSDSSLGLYEITVDAGFETKSLQFSVVTPPKLDTIIEKENRISKKEISILTEEKYVQNTSVAPRVVSGSLITPSQNDQLNVNIHVTTNSGICIIGTDVDCLVKDSTRAQGKIYDIVEIDGMNFNVRYSGPDVRLEKFSILPESSSEFLPDTNWNVKVVKDDEISRFYYKVTYKTLE